MGEVGWTRVGRVDDLRKHEATALKINDVELAIYRLDDGCYALHDICTHAFAHLSSGFVEGDVVECPLHQARFEIRTGKSLDDIAPEDLSTYEVKVENGDVFVRV
jgi:NAD(P)H-dependent nitrite reductase small subunit